ncbi:GNAT family N-acetyltransferase [Hymenobacter sp. BT507]|uniref:GNAT family N-acetyltransferase n=1 Tax=Hymenobacter citatus TaxID=2763506 RepID=A0ABR7MFK4_9BACT|nr:GNAT family N-acetyltransferase [Hymenobacter citatus]MBC6609505.1 GNAT family N-acetyltransferase [Hymenobacter citatus]
MMRYIRHDKVNRVQWDALIEQAPNGLIYALTWYLDIVSPGWEALVKEEQGRYVVVMPLPVRRKFGFRYLQQPLFVQQLGVFSVAPVSARDWEEICSLLRQHFRLITHYAFNTDNLLPVPADGVALPGTIRTTYHIALQVPYAQIVNGYTSSRKRQLQQARKHNLVIEPTTDIEQLIHLFDQNTAPRIYGLIGEGHTYPMLRRLYYEAKQRGLASIWQAKTTDGSVVASMLLLEYKNKVIYLFNSSSEKGKATRAISLLIDAFFIAYAGTDLVFDFEAPEVPSLVQFYSSFGSTAVPYFSVSYDQLPWPVQLIKSTRMHLYRWLSRNQGGR